MKKLITLLAVVASFAVLTPTTSQARDGHGHSSSSSFSHSCGSCRAPIYRQRVVVGRDRHGYRTVSHSCRSSHGRGHSSHGHSSHGHNGSHGGFSFFGFGR